ncbi:sugar kinase [Thiohalorhabdus denitrificans]|uniref:Adenosine kinase n=1 Tax=Thiohalorhabdus denitrificans TaxID=381306 RepID=A0A0N8PMS2_9GAMM|nr:carbohydrate kinase family protein [Thiohalorhabdus denitrificans]KPV39517.1 sugar kinase [Thiohalorhabdus denitrificans]SCY00017.1 adenosine kinase [Thiohalorhabdus denitrificans]
MSALIAGSFAFDNILVFHDKFKNHILPDKVHILNVAFLVPSMRREFGGTAGNIAFNLKLLGDDPIAMGAVGTDFGPYAEWMDKHGISRKYVKEIPEHFTAQAFITTDEDDNQITAFHPGAMGEAHQQKIADVTEKVEWGIVSPDGKDAMIEHSKQFKEAGIPFIFDPGQGLPMFSGDELLERVDEAEILAVNDYEWQMVQDKTGHTAEDLSKRVSTLIVTKGGEGSEIYTQDGMVHVPTAKPNSIEDPTGCGDAYRAGLLFGLTNGFDWETTGRIAATMGAYKIESKGPQNHSFTIDEFKARMEENFGSSF